MKKLLIVLFIFASLISLFACQKENEDYLRIHIRANSNSEFDQFVKMQIKEEIVAYMQQKLEKAKSVEDAKEIVLSNKAEIENITNEYLKSNGINYLCEVNINNEYFPTREYEDIILEEGYYDAIIVSLGKGEGNNWWCVAFPPLCFKAKSNSEIKPRWLIKEIFDKFIKKAA